MLCWSLLSNEVDWLNIYIYPLPLESPSHPRSTPLGHHRALHWALCYRAASYSLSILHTVLYICQGCFLSSSHPALLPPHPRVHCSAISNSQDLEPTSVSINRWEYKDVQFSSVTQSCLTLCDPMDCSTPGLPVYHLLELAQTHVHQVSDAIQPSHPLSSPSPPTFNLSQHQGLFRWVSCLHQVVKGLELQLQHQSFQWIFRTDFF